MFASYPVRILLTILVTLGGIALMVVILAAAPNFFLGILFLLPLVPLLRLIGDLANPDVDVALEAGVLLRHYLGVLFLLVVMLAGILMALVLAIPALIVLASGLALLIGCVALLLWGLQYGFGVSLGRPLDADEWQLGLLIMLGGGGVGVLALGLIVVAMQLKERFEQPVWQWIHHWRNRIEGQEGAVADARAEKNPAEAGFKRRD